MNFKRIKPIQLTLMFMALVMITGCDYQALFTDNSTLLSKDETYEKEVASGADFQDLDSLYTDDLDVRVVYLTVGKGSKSDGTNHTWEELNGNDLISLSEAGADPYKCEALVQFGNEDGPVSGQFGFRITEANATVKLYGTNASKHAQKNYKIDIKEGAGKVDDMKTFVLTKSFTDPLRITNMLSFRLLEEVPELFSTRTSFVHLYVKDVTETSDTKFVDYGLYTMVEPINKKYFKNRNLDNSGELYKAVNFDFSRNEEVLVQPTSYKYSEKEFEKILESKGSNDYSNLLEMLDAVNDSKTSIEEVINTYFDEENLFYWMAFNILMDQKATCTENYYLYNPIGTRKFYFIPWDNDGALRSEYEYLKDSEYEENWRQGIYLYADSVFFGQILKSNECVDKLSEAVTSLYEGALSPEKVSNKAALLASVAKDYVYSLPDSSFARVKSDDYDYLLDSITQEISDNYYAFYDSLETPAPFHIYAPQSVDGKINVSWEESYVLNGTVSYVLEVADSWDFEKPVLKVDGITDTDYELGELKSGQYFIRVTAVSQADVTQSAFEYYNSEKKSTVNGVLCFYVKDDKSVSVSTFK